jgi:hypothetical protein
MREYKFNLVNAAFVASGIAVQAKGVAYRLASAKGDGQPRSADYGLGSNPGLTVRTGSGSGARSVNEAEDRFSDGDYWLGRPALTDLALDIPGEGVLLVNDAVVNVSLQKEIVRTVVVGRKGSIKEYICDGDYQLSVSVGLVAVNDRGEIIDQYPERAVAQLREILERPEAIEVSSVFLGLFGINRIVVTGFSARQMTHSNRQVIEISAVSDDDYLIEASESQA